MRQVSPLREWEWDPWRLGNFNTEYLDVMRFALSPSVLDDHVPSISLRH